MLFYNLGELKMISFLKLDVLVRVVLMTICCILVYPLLVVLIVPLWVYQCLVQIFVKQTNPKISRILTGVSGVLAGRDPYSNPIMTLCPCCYFDCKLDLDHVIKTVNEKWINTPYYPELKQRLVYKFGFHFWENVDDFKVENHVRYLYPDNPDKIIRKSEVRGQELENVVMKSFDKRYSPWEIILIPNVFDPNNLEVRSALYFNMNHCLMDGQSIMHLFEAAGTTPHEHPTAKTFLAKENKNRLSRNLVYLLKFLELVFTGPYHAIQLLLSNDKNNFLEQTLSQSDRNKQEILIKSDNEPWRIKMDNLKALRQKHHVGMSALITTLVICGVIKFIRRKCNDGFAKLPDNFVLQMVSPLPGHPKKLVNHW